MLFIETLLPVTESGEEVMSQQEKGERAQNVAELKRTKHRSVKQDKRLVAYLS